jgi:hypothetical protein
MEQNHVLQRAPVAFLIFNRPAFTAQVFEAIARARPPRLLVVADGPRPTHPDDSWLCAQARAVIDQVDWPCEVLTDYSEVNLGCKLRIASGLDWVFSQAEEAIVLEDDTLPDPSFFTFCEELLERYRDDRRVHMVSGCNAIAARRFTPDSYYFSRLPQIWGWASWARAWETYDLDMRAWPGLRESDWLTSRLGGQTEAEIARTIFNLTYDGRVPTWDFQWAFAALAHDALSIRPSVNLVRNIGFGSEGTHERDPSHGLANLPVQAMEFPLSHPAQVAVLQAADDAEWRHQYPNYFREAASGDAGVRRGLRRVWRTLSRS